MSEARVFRALEWGNPRATAMVNHASTRTTELYDRHRDDISFDEVEWIRV